MRFISKRPNHSSLKKKLTYIIFDRFKGKEQWRVVSIPTPQLASQFISVNYPRGDRRINNNGIPHNNNHFRIFKSTDVQNTRASPQLAISDKNRASAIFKG